MSGTADVRRIARSWVASEGLLLAAPGRESHGSGARRWALLSPLMEPAVIAPAHSSCGCGGAVLVLSAPQLNGWGFFSHLPADLFLKQRSSEIVYWLCQNLLESILGKG